METEAETAPEKTTPVEEEAPTETAPEAVAEPVVVAEAEPAPDSIPAAEEAVAETVPEGAPPETAEAGDCPPVDIQLVPDPDPLLAASSEIVATGDSAVLDACTRWFNLARTLIERRLPSANLVPMND